MKLGKIIGKPIITEKSVDAASSMNRYSFKVDMNASKGSITKAIEDMFNVKVSDVRTMIMPGKRKRVGRTLRFIKTSPWKKAIIELQGNDKIELFEKLH